MPAAWWMRSICRWYCFAASMDILRLTTRWANGDYRKTQCRCSGRSILSWRKQSAT